MEIITILLIALIAFIYFFPKLFGWILLFVVLIATLYQYYVVKKNKEKNLAIQIVTKKIKPDSKVVRDSLVLGTGSAAISLYEMYASVNEHDRVLTIIEERFPHAVNDLNFLEWHTKIEDLYRNGSLDTYVSAYAGEKAEQITVESFREQGWVAEQFSSKTHPDNDIRVYEQDGTYTDYSVKNLESIHHFKQEIQDHPNSTHYVVNKEIYIELEDRGLLKNYESQGLTIVCGEYSNEELRKEATVAFEQILNKGDITDSIPLLGGILFLGKSYHNLISYKKGSQSSGELRVNLISDAFKVSTAGTSAFVGAKIGMLIGTSATGPIGGIIATGIGAVIGSVAGSKTLKLATDYLKWPDVFKAQSHFGLLNKKKFIQAYSDSIADKVFNRCFYLEELKKEEKLLKRYEEELDPFSNKPLTLPAILCDMYIKDLRNKLEKIDQAIELTRRDLLKLSEELARKMSINIVMRKKIEEKLYGEIFLSNKDLFDISLDGESDDLKEKYQTNREKNPNYPTRLPNDSTDILVGLSIRNFNNIYKVENHVSTVGSRTWIILAILFFLSVLFIYPGILKLIYIAVSITATLFLLYQIGKSVIHKIMI